jgi:5-formyltetrahydrofolate cyclo-ligase
MENDEIIARKQALRLEMKGRRAHLNEMDRARASWALCQRLLHFLETRSERIIGVYLSRPFEISLDPMIAALLHGGYTVAAPRVDLERNVMSFWRLRCLDEVERGPWSVREPLMEDQIEELPLMVVPGLAFDLNGGRLGMGGGWYDRFLKQAYCVVGAAFDCQIVPAVPLEAHDVRVDSVVTECRWFDMKQPPN